MIRDVAAANASLSNDYGAGAGSGAAGSHELHLFAGDPNVPELDGGGVLLTGYVAPVLTNDGTTWSAPTNGAVTTVAPVEITFAGALADVATHFALKDPVSGLWWDTGRLATPLIVVGASVKGVQPTIAYASAAL